MNENEQRHGMRIIAITTVLEQKTYTSIRCVRNIYNATKVRIIYEVLKTRNKTKIFHPMNRVRQNSTGPYNDYNLSELENVEYAQIKMNSNAIS